MCYCIPIRFLNNHGCSASQTWVASQALGAQCTFTPATFPSLTALHLDECTIDGATFIASLLLCPQLQKLELLQCLMTPAAVTALPLLQQLQQLREIKWSEPEDRHKDWRHWCGNTTAAVPQLAQLTQLTHITLGRAQAATRLLIAAVTGMTNLVSFTMEPSRPVRRTHVQKDPVEVLSIECLTQLLNSCTLLTTISMEDVMLDEAGLDMLLAHPHVVDVTLLAIAATESRVDSPCSWRSLRLAHPLDIRTVAFVPLHSLQKPLRGNALLLPPDVPPDQLPQLLLKATTRIAEHSHLFNIPGNWLVIYDHVTRLASMRSVEWRGEVQPAFSPTTQSALLAALEPLAEISSYRG
jgi:hypothetical protein